MKNPDSRNEKDWKRRLGASIKKHRLHSGLTQAQAAQSYGCSLRWWQHLEGGRNISVKTLLLIASILFVKPWLLLVW